MFDVEEFSYAWPSIVATAGAEVRRTLDEVDPALWENDPWLVAAYGASYRSIDTTGPSAALTYFAAATTLFTDDMDVALRVAVMNHHSAALRAAGRLAEAEELALEASERSVSEPTMRLTWRINLEAKSALQLGLARYHLGDFDAASTNLALAASLAQKCLTQPERVECFSALAMVEYSMGDFAQSVAYSALAREEAQGSPLLESAFGAGALIAELLIAIEQGRLDDALILTPIVERSSAGSDWEPLGWYAQAAVSIISEEYVHGLDLLRSCVQAYRHWSPPGFIVTVSEGVRATLLLRLGETDSAWDILGTLRPTQHHANCPARFIAHLRFITGDAQGTLDALSECEALGDSHSGRTLVDVQLLKACALLELGNRSGSDVAFDRALSLAARNEMRIPFRLVPPEVMRRLLDNVGDRPQPPRVGEMIASVTDLGPDRTTSSAQLSVRERDIMRLAARDRSVHQISEELYISVNTVKSHLKSIYRKLGVSSRSEARKKARELGLHVQSTPG